MPEKEMAVLGINMYNPGWGEVGRLQFSDKQKYDKFVKKLRMNFLQLKSRLEKENCEIFYSNIGRQSGIDNLPEEMYVFGERRVLEELERDIGYGTENKKYGLYLPTRIGLKCPGLDLSHENK